MPATERRSGCSPGRGRSRPSASTCTVPAGLTVAEIVGVAIPDPAWHDNAVVLIGDERIERRCVAPGSAPSQAPSSPFTSSRAARTAGASPG